MKHGFVKVASATPDLKVGDVEYNVSRIIENLSAIKKEKGKIIVFPELCMTGYTCGDLFLQERLLKRAREGLEKIQAYSKEIDGLIFIGLPLAVEGKLYNVVAALNRGRLLGFTTKSFLPNYSEFYEMRQFQRGPAKARFIDYRGEKIPFGPKLLFRAKDMESCVVTAEICEDLWSPIPPSIEGALGGATIVVNASASNELVGKAAYRRELIKGQSARLICGYVYSNAGIGESTTDVVFGGHDIIAENGSVLKENKCFENEIIYSEIDTMRILMERQKNTTFSPMEDMDLISVPFEMDWEETPLTREFPKNPFVPEKTDERGKRCEEILMIQAMGLRKRLDHIGAKTAVVGISGGLDSTLALLVMVKTFELLKLDKKGIIAVTMPSFGTTDRTYTNACFMTKKLGATLREIPIGETVRSHFKDIGQDENVHDVTYENAQARERTQVLMDVANQVNGIVIGTGDLSELALGWATYNGDHMSMYGVNASIPKTLVRYLVEYYGNLTTDVELKEILFDVLDTPVSPELIPPKDGEISQRTEDLVGPYELHDFFLYYMLRFGYEKDKIFRIAKKAFDGEYKDETIEKWLDIFIRRFFNNQFKRSALPDGPKVGSVALSPRGDLRMPSDASSQSFL
ncbi:NAD+ synthase (glutamine-hydrolyzing) [Aequitasia blattaphilus]|uniref:Glutamine-dependent NAD(+) synthetase n=1 Tax=Aequitasia blattaphilus TaxID=2949332 RepID=A0ABT1E627_9FIRM|nr:NAD(+) synthase [Aequitasia blattaphilus]MCP1101299.1 NAD(+) synthase [Aequitasia blattaphilus]MCR8613939.1 NAD(+) synthase [Aequitasia blattaphilus]